MGNYYGRTNVFINFLFSREGHYGLSVHVRTLLVQNWPVILHISKDEQTANYCNLIMADPGRAHTGRTKKIDA